MVRIQLQGNTSRFSPRDVLVAEYKIDSQDESSISSVESSVIWRTVGKGEEDYGVHFFERRSLQNLSVAQWHQPHRISTVLPASPLSYDGQIIKIRWCVRLRLFNGKQQLTTEDCYFQLGDTSTAEYETITG